MTRRGSVHVSLMGALSVLVVGGLFATRSRDTARAATSDYTVLVYSHGDNDLDGSLVGPGDLNEMVKMADRVNFVVYHDRNAAKEEPRENAQHLDLPVGYSNTFVFRVGSDGKAKEVQDLGETYTMSPQTLAWFVYYGLTNYPARNTILVLDDHGGGPNAYFGSEEFDTPTDDPNYVLGPMSIGEVTSALRTGFDAASAKGWKGGANGKRLDGILHATCLNGNYEVVRALAPFTRYVWGSGEITSGTPRSGALDVDYSVSPPTAGVTEPTLGYLTDLVKDGPSYYLNSPEMAERNIARGIFDLNQIEAVTSALKTFVRTVESTESYQWLLEARSASPQYAEIFGYKGSNLFDLGDLIARIPKSAPAELLVARNALYQAIKSSRRYLATNGIYKDAQGLTIYFPTQREGMSVNYQQLNDPTGWTRLVRDSRIAGASPTGNVEFSATTTAVAWKASLTADAPFQAGTKGLFVLGPKGESSYGIRADMTVLATIGAGGGSQAQAVGTFHTFSLGGSPVTLDFNRDLTVGTFRAIWVNSSSRKQSEVSGTVSARFSNGTWSFGAPTYLQITEGSSATVAPSSADLLSPYLDYYRESPVEKDSAIYTLKADRRNQRGVPGNSRISSVAIPSAKPLTLVANIWDETYKTNGDLVIEQTSVAKP